MVREEFFGSEILRSNRGACLRVPSPGSPPRSGIECREARFCHPMKRARWGLRQTARSCSIGLDTPGWTTLSTNATCQQEKTENSAWNLVGRVPRDDSRTNAVARRGAVPNQPDVRNVRDTKPLPVRLDAVNKRGRRVRNSKGGSPEMRFSNSVHTR